jgi:methionine sulfoxide reductase heme-binding subunit
MPAGWPIVGWATLLLGAMIAAILAVAGTGEDAIRIVIRATARTSVVLFSAAFVASALRRAWPGSASSWLLANRRYLGVSFAVSHAFHLTAILALAGWSVSRMVADAWPTAAILGGIAYLFILAMVATSFDRTAAWLGPRAWSRLHTVSVYWIWTVFFASFAPRAFTSPLYAPFALLLVAALGIRLWQRPHVPSPIAQYSPEGLS